MPDVRNIIVGAAKMFIGVTGETAYGGITALPALTGTTSLVAAAGALTTSTSWRNVGYTMEGVELSVEPDFGEVEVDQLLDSARLFKQSMRVTANTTLAEATLENLLVVWGQSRPVASPGTFSDIDILAGELGDVPFERSLAFVGPSTTANGKAERIYWAARAVQTESTSIALRRSEATGLPASFRLLPDASQSSGPVRYGRIIDRTIV